MKEFSPLHCTISLLIRNCDISPYETETEEGHSPANPYMIPSSRADLQRVSEGMFQALFLLDNSKMFISEVRWIDYIRPADHYVFVGILVRSIFEGV